MLVDPPEGWKYGFPAPIEPDYRAQLVDAGYPMDKIEYALKHSRYIKEPKMNRLEILAEASAITGESRNKEYGEPKANLGDCALLWKAYLEAKFGEHAPGEFLADFGAEDVAWLNTLQKIARTFRGSPKPDTYIDAAAYAAIAGEVAE